MNRLRTLALTLTTLGLLAVAGPACAAGTGDVELVPTATDGGASTAFRVAPAEDTVRFELVNLADAPRTAKLYSASATRSSSGAISVGAVGSAPWLTLPSEQVELGPREVRAFTVPLQVDELTEGRTQLGAVVLEAAQGSVVVRVATLVTVEPRSALPLPLWAVVVAAGAILLVLAGLLAAWRRRRRAAAGQPELEVRELQPAH